MISLLAFLFALFSCQETPQDSPMIRDISILFLGDSYTIGQSVCENCRYPTQLVDSLERSHAEATISFDIIAKTGWTTTNLLNAIEVAELKEQYDFVYLLIGVNNQYQNKIFSLYEKEFTELLDYSLSKVNDNPKRVNVISIPDYAFTPFGQNGDVNSISEKLDDYNAYAKSETRRFTSEFINITDISRRGIDELNLVAPDGLHPSTRQYTLWLERIMPLIEAELFP